MDQAQGGDVAERTDRILDGFRAWGAGYTELTSRFATWLGLHATDATALVEILYAEDNGDPLSPTRLSRRLDLTTGATTNLLNRLQRLGHIVRTREHADQRVVTVRSSPRIAEPAREFFGPFTSHLQALVAQYPAEQLELLEDFLGKLHITMGEVLAEQEQDARYQPPR